MIHLTPEDIYKQIAEKLNLKEQQIADVVKLTFKKVRHEISNFKDKPPHIIVPNIGRFIPDMNRYNKIQEVINKNKKDDN